MAVQSRIVFRMAFNPLAIHEGKGSADVERVIANRHLRRFPGGIAEMLRPVIEMVELHATAGSYLRGAFARGGQRENQEIAIISDPAMCATAGQCERSLKSLTRAL